MFQSNVDNFIYEHIESVYFFYNESICQRNYNCLVNIICKQT